MTATDAGFTTAHTSLATAHTTTAGAQRAGAIGLATVAAGLSRAGTGLAGTGRGPGIGRQAAQRLARAELSRSMYHPSVPLVQRLLDDLLRWLSRLYQAAGTAPGGWWTVVSLTAAVLGLLATILAQTGPVGRSGKGRRVLTPAGRPRSAADHRREARARAEAGDYATAICDCVRATAAELDERGVLLPRPGRTTGEFAGEAGRALPGYARGLREAVRLFDEICYGKRPGSREGYEWVRDLDERIRAAAPPRREDRAAPPVAAGGAQ